ncbi:MAG: hypothetical protein F9K29_24030 [Hyphomicrobiaceae bacterium]|nr:MAG: hypothetical protein F9K29_24030 [Hyphomicrobiaceae bacterium]
MALVLTSGPEIEPVTLAEAKAHLRVDGTAEDVLISSLVVTSRLHIEAALGLALITQGWSYFIDAWPPGPHVVLPLRPVQSITGVRIYSPDESVETLPADTYLLDGQNVPARLIRRGALAWPAPRRTANAIEIAFVAGYGNAAANAPAPIRQAILILVAHWYEHREPVHIGAPTVALPQMATELLLPYRAVRL